MANIVVTTLNCGTDREVGFPTNFFFTDSMYASMPTIRLFQEVPEAVVSRIMYEGRSVQNCAFVEQFGVKHIPKSSGGYDNVDDFGTHKYILITWSPHFTLLDIEKPSVDFDIVSRQHELGRRVSDRVILAYGDHTVDVINVHLQVPGGMKTAHPKSQAVLDLIKRHTEYRRQRIDKYIAILGGDFNQVPELMRHIGINSVSRNTTPTNICSKTGRSLRLDYITVYSDCASARSTDEVVMPRDRVYNFDHFKLQQVIRIDTSCSIVARW